jgi:hypothetical protein
MSHRRLVILLALSLGEAAIPLACAPRPVARAPLAENPVPAIGLAESQPTSAAIVPASSSVPVASDTAVPLPVASAPESVAPPPRQSAEPDPPCVDGELIMGACICESGKSADGTGHCVFVPCPRTAEGRISFRDKATGQCMECRSGFRPTSDGKCEP